MLHMICHTCQQCDMRTPGMYDQQCTAVEMKVHIIRIGEVNTNDMHANTGNYDLNVKLWVGAKKRRTWGGGGGQWEELPQKGLLYW